MTINAKKNACHSSRSIFLYFPLFLLAFISICFAQDTQSTNPLQGNKAIKDALESNLVSDDKKTELLQKIADYQQARDLYRSMKDEYNTFISEQEMLNKNILNPHDERKKISDEIEELEKKTVNDLFSEKWEELISQKKEKNNELLEVVNDDEKSNEEKEADIKKIEAEIEKLNNKLRDLTVFQSSYGKEKEREELINQLEKEKKEELQALEDQKKKIEEELEEGEKNLRSNEQDFESRLRQFNEAIAKILNIQVKSDPGDPAELFNNLLKKLEEALKNQPLRIISFAENILKQAREENRSNRVDSGGTRTITLTPKHMYGLGGEKNLRELRQLFGKDYKDIYDEIDERIDTRETHEALVFYENIPNWEEFTRLYGEYWKSVVKGAAKVFDPRTHIESFKTLCELIYIMMTDPEKLKIILGDSWEYFKNLDDEEKIKFLGELAGSLAGGKVIQELRLAQKAADITTNTNRKINKAISNYKKNKSKQKSDTLMAATRYVDPQEINFSQRTVGSDIYQYAKAMKEGKFDWNRSGPIIVMYQDGKLVSYDNRRLMAARMSGVKSIPVKVVDPNATMPGSTMTWGEALSKKLDSPKNIKTGGTLPKHGTNDIPGVVHPRQKKVPNGTIGKSAGTSSAVETTKDAVKPDDKKESSPPQQEKEKEQDQKSSRAETIDNQGSLPGQLASETDPNPIRVITWNLQLDPAEKAMIYDQDCFFMCFTPEGKIIEDHRLYKTLTGMGINPGDITGGMISSIACNADDLDLFEITLWPNEGISIAQTDTQNTKFLEYSKNDDYLLEDPTPGYKENFPQLIETGEFEIPLEGQAPTIPNPDDPLYNSSRSWGQEYDDQWALKRIGFTPAGEKDSAWNISKSASAPVITAVIDSGCDRSHPELTGSLWVNENEIPGNGKDDDKNGFTDDIYGWNFVNNNNDITDYNGHGTVNAGLIAASINNHTGIAGINSHAIIMPLKALDFELKGGSIDLCKAIFYAVDNGARVINISIGGKKLSRAVQLAIAYAHQKGVVVVAAAGNGSLDTSDYTPAGLKYVITVSSTDTSDQRTGFSNWGQGVDIAAPGVDILSLRARGTDLLVLSGTEDYKPGTAVVGKDRNYYRVSGTSFSAPLVSGVASLLFSHNPRLTAIQVQRMILSSAEDIGIPGWDQYTGYGILNARKALQADPDYFTVSRVTRITPVKKDGKIVIHIHGTAASTDFKEAWVELGFGERPGKWKQVGEKLKKQVILGQVGEIKAKDFTKPGKWSLRLMVKTSMHGIREARGSLDIN